MSTIRLVILADAVGFGTSDGISGDRSNPRRTLDAYKLSVCSYPQALIPAGDLMSDGVLADYIGNLRERVSGIRVWAREKRRGPPNVLSPFSNKSPNLTMPVAQKRAAT